MKIPKNFIFALFALIPSSALASWGLIDSRQMVPQANGVFTFTPGADMTIGVHLYSLELLVAGAIALGLGFAFLLLRELLDGFGGALRRFFMGAGKGNHRAPFDD